MTDIYNTNSAIGKRIKYYRKINNMTLKELGARANLSESAIQRYEAGSIINISFSVLQRISSALNISLDMLLDFKGDFKTPTFEKDKEDELTPKDEKHVAKLLKTILDDIESGTTFSALGGTVEDEVEKELFKRSLHEALKIAKKNAKRKYTPKKYKKE